jgi:hypothetical protein
MDWRATALADGVCVFIEFQMFLMCIASLLSTTTSISQELIDIMIQQVEGREALEYFLTYFLTGDRHYLVRG